MIATDWMLVSPVMLPLVAGLVAVVVPRERYISRAADALLTLVGDSV